MQILSTILLSIILFSCSNVDSQNLLSPKDFAEKIKTTNGQLLDVRTKDEYAIEHLKNSLNIDYYSTSFESEISQLDKSNSYFVYCQRGGRSADAVARLKKAGFKNVFELDGGVVAWEKAGLELEKTSEPEPKKGFSLESYNELTKSQKLVLVDFNAKWCGPCRKLSPIVDKIGKQRPNDVKVVFVDVDENEIIAKANSIEELPTLAWYKEGKLVLRMIGLRTEKELNETIDGFLK